jgi:ATP-dependent exoDNAse (exonuclease V) alpha subunit
MIKQYKQDLISKKKKSIGVIVKKLAYDKNSQDVELLTGMPCIGRMNNRENNIINNASYTIKAVDEDDITLFCDENKTTITLQTKDFSKYFYIGFAITAHKSQGATFNFPHTLHEFEKYDKKMKYVALTRTTNKNYINIF